MKSILLLASFFFHLKSLYNTGNKDTIVPEAYNFIKEYPNCARKIVIQRNCSYSFAVAVVSAITDRWYRANDL